MLQPGLGRATAFGVLGFMTASLVIVIIRGLQGLDPLYDPTVGVVFGGFTAAIFFIWGIGAFNPLLSVHGAGEEEAHAALEKRARKPEAMVASITWSLIGWLVLILVLIIGFATLPYGFALTITADPMASTAMVGFVEVTIGSSTLVISQIVLLIIFIAIMFISLFTVAGALGYVFFGLNRGMVTSQQEAGLKLGSSPLLEAGAPVVETRPARELSPLARTVLRVALFVIVFAVLYLLFYYVAIGLIFPAQPWLTILSLVNALIFTVLIVRPAALLVFIGRIAALLARFVRWLPKILFQRG